MRRVLVLLMVTALAGCATFKPQQISYDDEQPAVLQGDPPSVMRLSRKVLMTPAAISVIAISTALIWGLY